jgi:glycosidase
LRLNRGGHEIMSGQRISLDGQWHFWVDRQDVGLHQAWHRRPRARDSWGAVQIPGPWEQHGINGDESVGWYRREFDLPKAARGARRAICLAGIDDTARVWLNGLEVTNESPRRQRFAFGIDRLLRTGRNVIVIRVPDRGRPGGILRNAWLGPHHPIDKLLHGEYSGASARPSADWVRDAVVYEVYLRSFSAEGTFDGLRRRLDGLRELGATVIWLMPIHPIGRARRKGSLGSPYAVSDHYSVNAEFGTREDFAALLEAAHKRGMKLIIDLVANHTAWDSVLLREHPDWFARDRRGNIRSPSDDWHDVAQLDYGVPEVRDYMAEVMLYWVREVGVDGFRCDVADRLPTDFWSGARERLDAVRPIMLLAEDDQPVQHQRAFDLTYDWRTYQALGRLRAGRLNPASIDAILANERLDFPAGSLRLRFSSNHDLCAFHRPGMERYGLAGAKAAAVLTHALPGVPLIYNGQEAGNRSKLSLFERVPINWSQLYDFDLRGLYAYLARLRRKRPSLRRGETQILSTLADRGILGITRPWREETTCVLVNCTLAPCEIEAGEILPTSPVTLLGTTMPQETSPGRKIELPALGYWIGATP